jgi:hypothetical protein
VVVFKGWVGREYSRPHFAESVRDSEARENMKRRTIVQKEIIGVQCPDGGGLRDPPRSQMVGT